MTDKIAVVTGVGRGIGVVVSHRLVAANKRVALVSRTEGDLTALANNLGREYALPLVGDVASDDDVERIFCETEIHFGPIDILINNAGIPTRRSFEIANCPTEDLDLDRILGVNLRGAALCARAAVQRMREGHSGTTIKIGSISGVRAAPNVLPYSRAKFGSRP